MTCVFNFYFSFKFYVKISVCAVMTKNLPYPDLDAFSLRQEADLMEAEVRSLMSILNAPGLPEEKRDRIKAELRVCLGRLTAIILSPDY